MREDAEGGKPSNYKKTGKKTGKQGPRRGGNSLEHRLLGLYMRDAITAENFTAAIGDLKAGKKRLEDAEQKVLHLIRISN